MTVEQASRNADTNDTPKVIAFARHETFHPRFGWLKKGFDLASIDSEIFYERMPRAARCGEEHGAIVALLVCCV